MNEYITKLNNSLQEELSIYSEPGVPLIKKLNGALTSVRETLAKLKQHVIEHPFRNEQEEIDFFKHQKPKFVAEQLYLIELTMIQTTRPPYDSETIRCFFTQELQAVRRFFDQHKLLYQYFQADASDMDLVLFLRGRRPSDVLLPEMPDLDGEFSAAGDFIFAKFVALERLQDYLLDELQSIDWSKAKQIAGPEAELTRLKWTGESINLVELAYGIWLTGQINYGNATITEILEWLEIHLQIRIGLAFRRWFSISKRKRVSQTKFIDQLKAAVLKRLDDENGVK
ncbi:MAG: RteC protein [Mucilaginibacter sp.]|nr:RteC protein [Mucilaginibacter sp.]